MSKPLYEADVCLILEGSYPYIAGGVSSWVQSVLSAHPDLTFYIISIIPSRFDTTRKYQVPDNVVDLKNIVVQKLSKGDNKIPKQRVLFKELEITLLKLQNSGGGYDALNALIELLLPLKSKLGSQILLNSSDAWEMVVNMYYKMYPQSSFLDFFWTWRGLVSGLYSMILSDLPKVKVYHAISTGYAGLYMARACIETRRPGLLTEHGIYTNERRIEIALADWLYEIPSDTLDINNVQKQLTDMWIDSFVNYSRACYQAANEIITLYSGNQLFQKMDDAPVDKLKVIPNGVDPEFYQNIEKPKKKDAWVVAFIGRVVPIKDVKTFILSCKTVLEACDDVKIWVLGPTDEDKVYYQECVELLEKLKLTDHIEFTGRVDLKAYWGEIDVIVLTSLSEAQPLVILEAGAMGIPCVATDVGACSEMILGMATENPPLGPGGIVTGLASPDQTAKGIIELLRNKDKLYQYGNAIKNRVFKYYNKADLDRQYKEIYRHYMSD